MSQAHLDISPQVLVGLLQDNSEHHFRVDAGLPPWAEVDDVTWDPKKQWIRLHFKTEIPGDPTLTDLGCRNLLSSRALVRMVAGP